MQKLIFAAALLASPCLPATAAAPATQIDDLSRTDIRRAPRTSTTSPFLYAVLPAEQDVGIVHYANGPTLDIALSAVDRTRAQVARCTGSTAFAAQCTIARNLETQWSRGDEYGARIWYSRDLAGNPQCYSLDGNRCLTAPATTSSRTYHVTDAVSLGSLGNSANLTYLFTAYDVVSVRTYDGFWTQQIVLPQDVAEGSTFQLTVDSTNSVIVAGKTVPTGSRRSWVYSAGSWRDGNFNPPAAASAWPYHVVDAATLATLVDGANLAALFAAHDVVSVRTYDGFWSQRVALPHGVAEGSTFRLTVDSTYSVIVAGETVPAGSRRSWIYSAGVWRDGDFDPNAESNRLAAVPVRCGDEPDPALGGAPRYTWCSPLRRLERRFHTINVADAIDRKYAHTGTLFDQYEDWSVAKVDVDNRYPARLNVLLRAIDAKAAEVDAACAPAVVWLPPFAIACLALRGEWDDLTDEYNALGAERDARVAAARTAVVEKRARHRHRLHETWAASDQTHFAALLKEESKELDELKQLKAGYDKTTATQHQAYLDAVARYQTDSSPLGLAEHLPLIGPEIRHIAEFARNPSTKNLRRMLLGLVGPIGEAVEGVVELTTGDGGLSAGETKFLTDMLGAMSTSSSFTSAMETIVGDAINDLGDEAIDSLRQVGLLADRAGGANEPRSIDFASIVDLRARARPVTYDPWTATGEAAAAFRAKFTPSTPGTTAYMSSPGSYDRTSPTSIELASAGTAFEHSLDALFAHAMGRNYNRVVALSAQHADWRRNQVNAELYKVVADPAYAQARRAYWVTSATIGQRHAALIYDNDHAVIVLNADLVKPTEDWSKYYIEELGHLVNWWRCDLFDIEPARCALGSDVGARFRDAVLVDPLLHEGSYEALLAELPPHAEVDRIPARFNNGKLAWIDGWPSVYTIGDDIASKTSFSFLMRAGLDIDSEYPGVSDEFDVEFVIGSPKPAMRGNPWKESTNGYCKTDTETDCNMPTMWLAISFRDALKLSIAGLPQVKSTAFAQTGVDFSPRLVRKHGGKLPFQLESVNGVSWKYADGCSIYFKKFTLAAEAKIDLWKAGHALKGAKPSSTHKPEFGAKAVPAEGSYVVEIATNDTADFAGWLAADLGSAVLGCAGGFVVALVSEQDPITMCHGFSDLAEAVETAFQGLDKEPTFLLEADGSVSLPSIEYKYATSGNKIRGVTSPGSGAPSGRAIYHIDGGTGVATLEEPTSPATTAARNPQVDGLKTKMRSGLSKLGGRGIKPIAVFRMRANFDYAQKVIQAGEYNLPAAVVTE